MRKTMKFLAVLCVGFLCVHAAKADGVNLVKNGDFESGDFSGWSGSYVTLAGTPPLPNAQAGVDGSDPYAGNYGAYLGAFGTNPNTKTDYMLSQSLTTTVGVLYTISFYLRNYTDPSNGYSNDFSASFGSLTPLIQTNAPASAYQLYTYTLAATSTTTLLSFAARNDDGTFDLDSVSVVGPAATTVTPEPSSFILLGTGLVGLAGVARRRLFS